METTPSPTRCQQLYHIKSNLLNEFRVPLQDIKKDSNIIFTTSLKRYLKILQIQNATFDHLTFHEMKGSVRRHVIL